MTALRERVRPRGTDTRVCGGREDARCHCSPPTSSVSFRHAIGASLNTPRWADIPAWVSAVSTLLALALAAVAAVATWRTLKIELERDRATTADRQREHQRLRTRQAAKISAWCALANHGDAANEHWGVYVRNASDTPVYQAHITAHGVDGIGVPVRVDLPVIPPGANAYFHRMGAALTPDDIQNKRTAMTFTDAVGVRWKRDPYGRLVELSSGLTIWGDPRLGAVLERFRDDYHASYGVRMTYDTFPFEDRLVKYISASGKGEIADIIDAPHDWIGTLVQEDVLAPIVLSDYHLRTFSQLAIDALSLDGRMYGVPLHAHCTALIRNLTLAPGAPGTFEQLLQAGSSLVKEGRARDILSVAVGPSGNVFYLSGIYTSLGGEYFGDMADGSCNYSEVSVDNKSSLHALRRMRDLGETGLRVLDTQVGPETALDRFLNGQSAFLIGTTDDLSAVKRAAISCDVAPVPSFEGGRPARPFVTITALFVARHGKNSDVAQDFLADYLTRPDVVSSLSSELFALTGSTLRRADEPSLLGMAEAVGTGVLMPAAPGVDQVWMILGGLQADVIRGADPSVIAPTAARRIRQLGLNLNVRGPGQTTSRPRLGAKRSMREERTDTQ